MSRDSNAVLAEALTLSPGERERIALVLLESIEASADEGAVDELWRAEVERRIEAWRSGRSTARPWSEVEADLRQRVTRR